MNELMQKITEKLNIAIDKAPDVYEMLKHQYIIYDVCNMIIFISIIVFTISFGLLFIFLCMVTESYGDERAFYKILCICLGIITLLTLISGIGSYIYRNVNAPDVLFLKEVLLGG
mgnify:CR=1 FL=1|nr:MAG TPA: hypothetical protein [Caudoviricetes sp.]